MCSWIIDLYTDVYALEGRRSGSLVVDHLLRNLTAFLQSSTQLPYPPRIPTSPRSYCRPLKALYCYSTLPGAAQVLGQDEAQVEHGASERVPVVERPRFYRYSGTVGRYCWKHLQEDCFTFCMRVEKRVYTRVFPLRCLDHEFRGWKHDRVEIEDTSGTGYSISLVKKDGFLWGVVRYLYSTVMIDCFTSLQLMIIVPEDVKTWH